MKTDTLNIGDRVLVRENYGFYGCKHRPGTVTKLTPTKIATVTVDEGPENITYQIVFSPDGYERGQRYRGRYLDPFDQKVLDAEAYKKMVKEKRDFLRDDKLWRETLSEQAILDIAARVEGELKMYARLGEEKK
jgi:hypothetical protein